MLAPVVMTEQEQLLLELVNRARANPVAEAVRFGTDLNADLEPGQISDDPKQPLAPNQQLVNAARAHSADMLDREFFDHVNPDGDGPSDRARAAGYPVGAGENIAWLGVPQNLERNAEVYRRHEALFLSESHRVNMMNPSYRELGTAVVYGVSGSLTESDRRFEVFQSIVVTEKFGNRGGDNFITGVVFTDNVVADNFYSIGESIGSATITATRNRDGATFSTTSGQTGGYGLQVPTGVYTVTAASTRLPGPMTFTNVVVLGENVKVDFNARNRSVARIAGVVFDDRDRDGVRDAGESGLVARTVFLDANEDGEQSPDETSTTTNARGEFVFANLLKGVHHVRQALDAGWNETAPVSGVRQVVLAAGQQRTGVSFGTFQFDTPPFAGDDVAKTESGLAVPIDAFANDGDAEGDLVHSLTQIIAEPSRGSVGLNSSTGLLVYTPNDGFVGTDTFQYAVTDEAGLFSNPATVTIEVTPAVGTSWQNPANALDVNNDSFVSSIDALLILNSITVEGSRRLPFPSAGAAPGPYLDVSGDGFVSPIDGLLVLNEVNRIAAERRAEGGGEGEIGSAANHTQPTRISTSPPLPSRLLASAVDAFFEGDTKSFQDHRSAGTASSR